MKRVDRNSLIQWKWQVWGWCHSTLLQYKLYKFLSEPNCSDTQLQTIAQAVTRKANKRTTCNQMSHNLNSGHVFWVRQK